MLRIAHRGAAGTRPELTRAAFERAMELGADMIELDVQLTRDSELVVLHDRVLGRTIRGSGAVRELALRELQSMDAGSWFDPVYAGERVMSLDEVFELTRGRIALNVEIKSPEPDWQATARQLAERLQDSERRRSTLVSCFDMGALYALRRESAAARLGVLWKDADLTEAWQHAARLQAVSVHPHRLLVDAEMLQSAHDRGLSVLVWTVNEPPEIDRLAALGVDGIFSDFPERLNPEGRI
jgi:glycerophosphoryl diester phosphodiesterase